LRLLHMHFESTGGDRPGDFFRYPVTGEAVDGKSRFLVGIALPPGQYAFTKIAGHVSEVPFMANLGQADFRVEIPFEVPVPGRHFYLGRVTVHNVATSDKADQRSGYATPLLPQIASGLGGGTLRVYFGDHFDEDQALLRARFQLLRDAVFDRHLLTRGTVDSAIGSGRPPKDIRTLRAAQPGTAPQAIAGPHDYPDSHDELVPEPSGYARLDDVDAVPRLGAKGKVLYREWLGKPLPRAVAISSIGAIARAYGPGAMSAALARCEQFGKPCRLYAVDEKVVFEPFPPDRHQAAPPAATDFAALEDVEAVPRLGPRGRELYREWLQRPHPRAIAVSPSGAMARGFGATAMTTAVANCEKFKRPCRLYAVDDKVVFVPFPAEQEEH
jgi:hypothetical protein